MIEIIPDNTDIINLFDNLRENDKQELEYYFKKNSKELFLKYCQKLNNPTMIINSKTNMPVAFGGVEKNYINGQKVGIVWLLCTKCAQNKPYILSKIIKNHIENYKKDFEILCNYIYKSNFDFLFQLKKLGFEVVSTGNPDIKFFYLINGDNKIDLRYFTCKQLSGKW